MTEFADRVFVINKQPGPTSFDVVEAFRRGARIRKVGHTGTLDPLAGGVLILCSGKATRAVEHFMDLSKTYEFEIRLGVGTTTLDAEGDVTEDVACPDLNERDVRAVAESFLGECVLEPPAYSAIKRNGKRLYELARAGEVPRVEGRRVNIYAFDVKRVELPGVSCRVTCSRGTYVRSLARDFATKLGLPAHIRNLVRTAIGRFRIEEGYSSDLVVAGDLSGLQGLTIADALDFLPGFVINQTAQRGLMNGVLPGFSDVLETIGVPDDDSAIRLLDQSGQLLAIGKRGEGAARDRLKCVDSYRLFADNGRP
ncbi:MAG: tRNA pseudouridine(55) synthase TruB [Candidatus Latescibacterota bacterium]|nr:MAG: tRNA pseudouridine(55) synthase TruB [Candidatus Latescibacterota bacterium]